MSAHVVVSFGPDPKKISKIATKNRSYGRFKSLDQEFIEYSVRVVENEEDGYEAGIQIPTVNGSYGVEGSGTTRPNQEIQFMITGADLQLASSPDGVKMIKAFVKTSDGQWSN